VRLSLTELAAPDLDLIKQVEQERAGSARAVRQRRNGKVLPSGFGRRKATTGRLFAADLLQKQPVDFSLNGKLCRPADPAGRRGMAALREPWAINAG
jgi:hypothetical protein